MWSRDVMSGLGVALDIGAAYLCLLPRCSLCFVCAFAEQHASGRVASGVREWPQHTIEWSGAEVPCLYSTVFACTRST